MIDLLRRFSGSLLISFILLVALNASLAVAAELKVVDGRGLIRLAKRVDAPVTVLVSLSSANRPSSENIYLSNLDGLAADIKASSGTNAGYVFRNVGEGTWQVKSAQGIAEVVDVKISKN